MSFVIDELLWICAIGTGVMGGIYFAFSVFIMEAFRSVPEGAPAMQAINTTILRTAFMPLFFGTTLASVACAAAVMMDWQSPGAAFTLAAGAVYIAGMFLVTVFFNVPLNNELARANPASADGAETWQRYLHRWTRWNHVRTLASTLACGLYIAAISLR